MSLLVLRLLAREEELDAEHRSATNGTLKSGTAMRRAMNAASTVQLDPSDISKARALLTDLVKSQAPNAQLESCRVTTLTDTALTLTPRVDRYSQIMVRCNQYSVPARFIGHRVRVKLSASAVTIYDRTGVVARHQRAAGKGVKVLDLDHYLEILARKPGALPGATALEQARAAGKFTPVHDAWWAAVRKNHGDAAGTRTLIEVLLLHRAMACEHVVAGIAAALAAGALTADAVAVEARKAAQSDTTEVTGGADMPAAVPPVTSLTLRRLAALPPDTRPLPSVAAYDQLLRRPPRAATPSQGDQS